MVLSMISFLKVGAQEGNIYLQRGIERASHIDLYNALDQFNLSTQSLPDASPAYMQRAQVKIRINQFDAAMADLERALHTSPEVVNMYGKYGPLKSLYETYKKSPLEHPVCKTDYYLAVLGTSNLDSCTDETKKAIQLYNSALSAKIEDNWPAALAYLNESISLKTDFPEAYFNRAYVKAQIKDYKGSLKDYDMFITSHPDDPMGYNNKGNLFMRIGLYDQAYATYCQAIYLAPLDHVLYLNRGISNLMQGRQQEACADFVLASERGNVKAQKKQLFYCR